MVCHGNGGKGGKKIWGMQSGGRRDRVIARDRNYPLLILNGLAKCA
jgi:hypothetical protein